jgi:lipopolysaccharide transport system ATP-binding protein
MARKGRHGQLRNSYPEILLLDEVFAVSDQAFQQKSLERIHELRRRGITIIFVSHSMG